MQELRREESREAGLTTADLANLDESASTKREANRERGLDRGLDRATADLESRQIEFNSSEMTKEGGSVAAEAGSIAATPAGNGRPDPADEDRAAPLLSPEESKEFHSRWDAVQVGFVDEPRQAVQQADGLVAGAMKRLAEIFAEERGRLDQQWDKGGDVSTEDLRIALRRYRSFFGRLLSV